ncbi:succinate dehydrogenase assembly factor 4, mitochondrial-like [Chrysoperla carnea]|uniref:succinate dehydrogenase assembly factor 4, mitochondrial-like n=1 Tax=Chrysoperla carnea TaxID=189513 RepID=UPI001D073D72|nr:succinate dehydrogenase assembly factor 4, mitochondrial-like [Chrysoperla carnea]
MGSLINLRILNTSSLMCRRIILGKYYSTENKKNEDSPKLKAFREKLRQKTPIGKLEEIEGKHPYQEQEPLPAWPNNTNPHTGEVNGPRGPEPTRYGDWERKGRVSDF